MTLQKFLTFYLEDSKQSYIFAPAKKASIYNLTAKANQKTTKNKHLFTANNHVLFCEISSILNNYKKKHFNEKNLFNSTNFGNGYRNQSRDFYQQRRQV